MTVPARDRGGARTAEATRTPTVWEATAPQAWSDEPMAQLRVLGPRFNRLLDELLSGWPGFPAAAEGVPARFGDAPMAELEELGDAWMIRMEVPGVRREDVDVQLAGRRLVVRAERKETERKGVLRRTTRTAGRYSLDVTLPGEVDPDDVEATLEDGVLEVRVAKPESAWGATRQIAVNRPGARPAG
jgi:HSP20 family protein